MPTGRLFCITTTISYQFFQNTFGYTSKYWSNKSPYQDDDYGKKGGFDNREFKGSAYWKTPFEEICVAMKYNGQLKGFSFAYPALSLYDLIADGNYRKISLGRSQWKELISGSSLQLNCNREGFNVRHDPHPTVRRKIRLGILSNNENNCISPDSFIGLGGDGVMNFCDFSTSLNTAGNVALCRSDNGNRDIKAMGYILVR